MAVRGFVSGVIWGSVVSVLGLGVVSQMAPMPGAKSAAAPTQTAAPATPKATPTPTKVPDPVGGAAQAPAAETTPTAPTKTPEAAVTAKVDPAPTTLPAVVPEPAPPSAPKTTPSTVKPALKAVPAAPIVATAKPAPDAPTPSAASADPAALGVPDDTPPAPTLPVAADAAPKPGEAARPAAVEADQQPAAAELPPVPPLTAEEQALLDQAQATPPAAETPSKPAPAAVPDTAPAPPVPDTPAEPAKTPAVVAIAPAPTPEPTEPLRPTPGLNNSAEGVTVGRLPSISAEAKPAAETVEAEADAGTAANPETGADLLPTEAQTPLQQFASRFENPDKKPLFAVILIDTGGPNVDRKALAQLPFPVTFAIDPAAADAATAAAIYRDAGQEVVMLATGIPQGATAADLEVTFQTNAAALPEAVAVLDLEDGGFQNDRPLATEVVPVVKGQGRGLVTWDKGLNAGEQVARRDGVPSAMVFRRLDGANENTSTVRRYLDRAAFKAAQDGLVTVVGQTSPDTVAALMEWAVEGRAASVAMAPISAVLAKP